MGHLGQGSTGERFMLYAEKGRRVQCPPGTTQESSGRMGTGQQYVQCYRAPSFAPPARTTTTTIYHAPTTTVSPSIQAQISPQVSPVLTQQQASPGAGVTAGPTQYQPGGQTARGGMTAAELQRILESQRAADDARRTRELQAMQAQMTARDRLLQEQRAAEQRAIAEREAARQQAEAEAMERARESAESLPPTAGAFVPPSPLQAPIFEPAPFVPPSDIDVSAAPTEAGQTIPYVLLAAAAIGVAFMLRGKKGAKSR